jgi:capsule polysaccharide export protein KpsE/RkpR
MADHSNSSPSVNLLDLLLTLARYKKRVLAIVFSITLVALSISLVWPKTYKSTVKFVQYNSTPGGSLGGLLNSFVNVMAESDRVTVEQAVFILKSNSILDPTIEEFNLGEVYGKEQQDLIREELLNNIQIEEIREGGIGFSPIVAVALSIIDNEPVRAQQIATFMTNRLDSVVVKINEQNSRRLFEVYEARYQQNLSELREAEEGLVEFQEKYGILELETQLTAMVETLGQLKAELVAIEVQTNIAKSSLSEDAAAVRQLEIQKAELEKSYADLIRKTDQRLENPGELFIPEAGEIFPPLMELPQLGAEYVRRFREVTVQNRIYELIYPQYEQKKLDLQDVFSGIVVIDEAAVPEYKHSPKRAIIVIAGFLFSLIFAFFSISYSEFIRKGQLSGSKDFEKYQELKSLFGKSN